MPRYHLPELRYDYGALEPHISGKIVQLHHDRHHRAYVDGANAALEALEQARQKRDFSRIPLLERTLAFNVSGHVLHSLFWQNLSPDGGGKPGGELADTIVRDFGSFESFKSHLIEAAMTTMGSGWATLAWEPASHRLLVTQVHDHQSDLVAGATPLLVLDAWEHAYYLQYGPDKAAFFKAIWNVWNWDDVATRFDSVRKLDMCLSQFIEGARMEIPVHAPH